MILLFVLLVVARVLLLTGVGPEIEIPGQNVVHVPSINEMIILFKIFKIYLVYRVQCNQSQSKYF